MMLLNYSSLSLNNNNYNNNKHKINIFITRILLLSKNINGQIKNKKKMLINKINSMNNNSSNLKMTKQE